MNCDAHTRKLLKGLGYLFHKVEKWNQFTRRKSDMWGADYIAFLPSGREVVLIQTTSKSNLSTRTKKVAGIPEVSSWLSCDSRGFVALGWYKKGGKALFSARTFHLTADGRVGWTQNHNLDPFQSYENHEQVEPPGAVVPGNQPRPL